MTENEEQLEVEEFASNYYAISVLNSTAFNAKEYLSVKINEAKELVFNNACTILANLLFSFEDNFIYKRFVTYLKEAMKEK